MSWNSTNDKCSDKMCFYDQRKFQCGDFKWDHFRQHCNREYRTGETCGTKLVMTTIPVRGNCKHCEKFETKKRRRASELDRINRWRKEGNRSASIARSEEIVQGLEHEIRGMMNERAMRLQSTR